MLLCLLLIFTHLHINFRIQLPCAIRADAVGEVGFGVLAYIYFHLVPVTLVVTDFFTARADGHDAAQGLNLIERLSGRLTSTFSRSASSTRSRFSRALKMGAICPAIATSILISASV